MINIAGADPEIGGNSYLWNY